MEKILLNSKEDLKLAISFFGNKYKSEITEEIANSKYPCILIGKYAEDIEFGSGYSFTTITKDDFNKKSGVSYF